MESIFLLVIGFFVFLILCGLTLIPLCIKVIQQYERGVILRWGQYEKTVEPGLRIIFPFFGYQKLVRVDIRQIAYEIAPQEVMTKDNINIKVGAVVYYRVTDPSKAILDIQNYHLSAISKTQAVLRDIVGTSDMNTILQSREAIAARVKDLVEADVEMWGLRIDQILIQQIELPADMVRAMAQQAVAQRNKEATITAANAELEASKAITKAAVVMSVVPGALRLRELQTIKDISSEKNEKIVIFMPANNNGSDQLNAEQAQNFLNLLEKNPDINEIAAAAKDIIK